MKNNIIKFSVVLTIITGFSVAILAFLNLKTQPLIQQHRLDEINNAVKEVMPQDVVQIEKKETDGFTFYIGYSDAQKTNIAGYATIAYGKGYSSVIQALIGVDTTFTITGTKVIFQQETPGLGSKIEAMGKYNGKKQIWIHQFIGKKENNIFLDKDNPDKENTIQALTGATISSRAVTKAIKKTLVELKNKTQNIGSE